MGFGSFMSSAGGGAVTSAAGGLVGNVIGGIGARKARKQQKWMFQESQKFERDEAQKGRDFISSMWDKNNQYNTPSAQLQRLKDANINPYLQGAVSAGMAEGSSGGAAPTANSVGAPSSSFYQPDMSPFAAAGQMLSQKRLNDSIAEGNEIGNVYRPTKEQLALGYTEKMIDKLGAETDQLRVSAALADKNLQTFDKRFQVEMSERVAHTYQLVELGIMNKNQAKESIQKALKMQAETQGLKLNNYVLEQTADSLIRTQEHIEHHARTNRYADNPAQALGEIGNQIGTFGKRMYNKLKSIF